MSAHTKVLNLTSQRKIKRSQARGRVEQCISVWIEEGYSIRDLTVAEMVAARSKQVFDREPLPMAEIPGLMDTLSTPQSRLLVYEASLFAQEVA